MVKMLEDESIGIFAESESAATDKTALNLTAQNHKEFILSIKGHNRLVEIQCWITFY